MRRKSRQVITGVVLVAASVALALGAAAPRASAATGPNLLANPGLETADTNGTAPASWSYSAWGTNLAATQTWSTDAHTGSRSVRVDITKYQSDGDAKWSPTPVAVTGGAYYALSDWYKANATSAISVEYWTASQPLSGDGTWVNLFSGIAPASDWTQFKTGFTMPDDAVAAIFVHRLIRAGYLETDDYAMAQEDAPPGYGAAMISLTFDDGSQGDYDRALPLLNAKGFKSTQYIPTMDMMNGDTSFMITPAELTTMAQQGHEIGSHTITHPDLTLCNPTCPKVAGWPAGSTLTSELQDSKKYLEGTAGVGTVSDIAYPYGSYDANTIAAEKAAGYVVGRSTEAGYNNPGDLQPYDIQVQNMTPSVTLDQFKGWVDYAIAHKYWLVIVYHEVWPDGTALCTVPDGDNCVDAYDTWVGQFQQQLDYISTAGIQVLTVRDAFAAAIGGDNPPVAGNVAITPTSPKATDVLTATPTSFSDPDGDTLTYSYTWKVGTTTLQTGASPTLPAGKVKHGDVVSVTVTASDPFGKTSSAATAQVTVVNSPPVKGTVTIGPASPTTNAVLTATPAGFTDADGDLLTFTYAWKVNGKPLADVTGDTLDLSKAGHGDSGDVITVSATADDGHSGTGTSDDAAPVTVRNSPPLAGTVDVSPDAPTVGTTLTAKPTGFSDPDAKDTLSYHYQWYVNNHPVDGETSSTLVVSGDMRGLIRVDVLADDGHGGVSDTVASRTLSVANAAPVAGSVTLAPVSPKTSAVLTATPAEFSDPDGDALSYAYQWFVNGAAVAGATHPTFDLAQPGHGDHGDTVSVSVRAIDGLGAESTAASAGVTVQDSAPVAGAVTVTPVSPQPGTALTATPTGFADPDGDGLTYTYAWYVNGHPVAGQTGPTLASATVPAGAAIRVDVRAADGHGDVSDPATAAVLVAVGDRTAPKITISSPETKAYWVGSRVAIRFSCSDSSGVASCTGTVGRIGGKATTVRNGQRLRLSSLGRYVLRITAKDAHGNAATKTRYFRTTNDRVAPIIRIASPTGKQSYRTGGMLRVRFSCSDTSGIARCRATLQVGRRSVVVHSGTRMRLSSTGHYVLRITATDRNDNSVTKTQRFSVKRG